MTQVQTPTEPRTARLSGAALGAFGMVVLAVVIGCGSLATSVFAGWNVWVGVLVAPLFALKRLHTWRSWR